ncbi:trimeric intracellular cation channel family protein [Pseudorhodoferax sp.]|uniref:trimeric intracellular cation channel family protein n=1 Tax=Pseudorhodoferax sp. TaxID=1993553 RepID=UPI002DD64FF5|nr:trimeric intracellular cation channel family protein [Pseudorhodoferax sp.]
MSAPVQAAQAAQWTLSHAQVLIEAVAIVAFALSGLLEAARKQLDAVGVVVVAGLAAFGGGTLRDVLLDRRPFFWVQHANWLWALLALCLLAMVFLRARHVAPTERAMQWPDALGLGLFAASGTQIALVAQMPPIVAVLMGMVTAVFGGVLRDIVCNEIPSAFRDHRPYAVCAFAGGWVMVAATQLGWPAPLALAVSAALTSALRVAALASGYRLPAWTVGLPPRP